MKRILVVIDTTFIGGIETSVLRFHQGMIRKYKEEFQYTYLVRLWPNGPMEQSFLDTGAKIIHQPKEIFGVIASYKYYKKLFETEKYDIVHTHSTYFNAVILKAAFHAGVKKRISHAHFTRTQENVMGSLYKKVYGFLLKKVIRKYASNLLACGQDAGNSFYGKKVFSKAGEILNNPVDSQEFCFDCEFRTRKRKEFHISRDTIVVGHIGRLCTCKISLSLFTYLLNLSN